MFGVAYNYLTIKVDYPIPLVLFNKIAENGFFG
jgi:hypothetical protein